MKDTFITLYVAVFALVCSTVPCYGAFYLPPVCPSSGRQVYPNDNCGLYYVCDDGMLKVLACPLGEKFDRILERCRPAFLVDCALEPLPTQAPNTTVAPTTKATTTQLPTTTGSGTKPSNTTTTTPKPTTAKNSTTPKPTTTTRKPTTTPKPTTTLKPICPSTGHVIIPTGDCVSYYNCTNGEYVISDCPPGNLLDPKTLTCGPFYDVTCYPVTTVKPSTTGTTRKPTTTTKAATSPPVECPPYGTEIVPTGDCVTYYNCTNGKYVVESCPSGELLDQQTIKCRPFFEVTCYPSAATAATTLKPTSPPPVECPSSGNENFPTGDCVTYYQCSNGNYSVLSCPSGDLYDSTTNQCLPFYSVTCYPQTTTSPVTVKTTVTATTTRRTTTKAPTTTQKATTKALTTTTTTTSKPETTSSAPTYACPASGHVSYPTGDCTSYYDCNNGVLSTQTCPFFTNFDPSSSACLPTFLYPCTPATVTQPPPAASVQSDSIDRASTFNSPPFRPVFLPWRRLQIV